MPRPSRPLARRAAGLSLGLTAVLALASLPALAKLETWRQDTSAAFAKGRRDRVVIADSGRVRLGRALRGTDKLDAARVWDLARSTRGVIYAATGDSGQVYRREGDGAWSLAHDGQDSQALALAATADGRVFAGTGPTGRLVEVSDPNALASVPDPAVRYIWDLAADSQSNLYAATGPTGQLWRRGHGRSCSTASIRICSASRSARTGRCTPAAMARA